MRYPPATYTSIRVQRIGDVHSRTSEWLWPGWLPLGKLTLLEGDPGLGKSLITLDLSARLTRGRELPDGCPPGPPCNVVVVNAEDTLDDTVRPRLLALGADLDRVFNLEGIEDRHGDDVLRFPQHAQALRDVLAQTRAKLLVMDPFVAFLDKGVATHNDQSVRAVLRLLMGIATEHRCAVLLVRHLNKEEGQRSLYRGGGSIGFVAAVRCAWLSAPDPGRADVRVLAQVKNNLQALCPSLAYQIGPADGSTSLVSWLGPSPLTCQQLQERKKKGRGRPRTQSERAEENLKLYMEEAPRTRLEVLDFMRDQQIAERTLKRAKQKLGVRSVWVDVGKQKAIYWLLPGQLPADVRADQLVPLETEQQEFEAMSKEGLALLQAFGEGE
jgi:hypothetical protein